MIITNRLYLPREEAARIAPYLGGMDQAVDFNALQPAPKELTGQELRDWCSAYWGCEENAWDTEWLGTIVTFHTMDTTPAVWLEELSRLFPQVELTLDWFYEGRPEDWNQCVIRNGFTTWQNMT